MVQDLLFGLFMAWSGFWMADPAMNAVPSPAASCQGALSQGGLLICDGPADAIWQMDGETQTASGDGRVLFGLGRAAVSPVQIRMVTPGGLEADLLIEIAAREDAFRVLEGLDCDKVDARTPEQIEHAGRSWVTKQEAFDTFNEGVGVAEGFLIPAEGPPSSPFGPERKYVGVSAVTGEPCEKISVHRGYDFATPVGTPIYAPASGTVILADPDLYYEGGTVFLDHGYGLVSVFMHMSAVEVRVGDVIAQGGKLGETGNTGRTTGPHLHWAVKWRNPDRETRDGDFYIDPALLLALPGPAVAEPAAISVTTPEETMP